MDLERFFEGLGLGKTPDTFLMVFFVGLLLMGALVAALVVVVTHG